jgi:GTP cyclohydrolase I
MVVEVNIPFRMLCEHHMFPATGTCAIGYLPKDRVVGLSKLVRLVDAVGTEAPGTQERITARVADLLNQQLGTLGTAVVIEAEHTCMTARGVVSPSVRTKTSSMKGMFLHVPAARDEFLRLIP